MSDDRRRLMCRIAFVVCCALPTILVANWILFPRSIAQWQTSVRYTLGCRVAIASVETPTPNEVRFHQLCIKNSQSQTLADFQKVDWKQSLDGQVLTLSPIELTLGQVTSLLQHLAEQLPKMEWGTASTLVQIPRLCIRSDVEGAPPEHFFVATKCLIQIERSGNQTRAVMEFVPDASLENPVHWEFLWGDPSKPTSWKLDAENAMLPCWLIAKAWPAVQNLGDRCWFAGILTWEQTVNKNTLEVQNLRVVNFDASKLLMAIDRSPQGTDQSSISVAPNSQFVAEVPSAHVINGRVQTMLTKIYCDRGQVSSRFLQSAKKWLNVDVIETNLGNPIEFAGLAVGFEIRDGELHLLGQPDGRIASQSDQQPLVMMTEESRRLSPQCLAGWLSGEDQIQIPVTDATLQLLSHLPLVR